MKLNHFAFMLIGIMLFSCNKKEEIIIQSPTSNQTSFSNARISGFTCPSSIQLNGGKVKVNIGKGTQGYAIAIEQNGLIVESASTTAGNSGNWISKTKFTSTQLGLVIMAPDGQVCPCSYDANGSVIPTSTNTSLIENFVGNYSYESGLLTMSWNVTEESNVSSYRLEKIQSNSNLEVLSIDALGTGEFQYPVVEEMGQVTQYRLVAVFNDGTEQEVANTFVHIAGAKITNFTANFFEESGLVMVNYQVLAENSVVKYQIEVAPTSSNQFVLVGETDPIGPGTYGYPDFQLPGQYTYRISAYFNTSNNNIERIILSNTTVIVPDLQ